MQDFLWILSSFGVILSLGVLGASYTHVVVKKNAYQITPQLAPLGIFVWADGIVISIFWLALSLITFALPDPWFLFTVVSLFWLVRSMGETIYWMLQQFVQPHANKPQNLMGYRFIKGDELWIIYQVAWQCITVISGVCFAYSAQRWLSMHM